MVERDMKKLFPQLTQTVRGRRLVYLDSAATSLKPVSVVEAVAKHLREGASNVHRGAHHLSDLATQAFEETREKVAKFLGAESKNEILFTRGTTEGVNLLARSLGSMVLDEGDEILLSQMEHHSNIVPWFMIAKEKKAIVKFVPVLESGRLDVETFKQMLSKRTKIVSLVHLSNALGTVNPLAELFHEAHKFGAFCIADAAQSVAAGGVNVQTLNCDFLVFSGHKMFGPTGVGAVYGKGEWLDKMPPYQGGGSMISEVSESGFTVLSAPHRFEAGTPPIAEVIGLGAAIDFIQNFGSAWLKDHERRLMAFAEQELGRISSLRRIGGAPESQHVYSFLLGKSHPSDVGAILDEQGIAVRAGHHCCQPLMKKFGIAGTVRASFAVYTSEEDIMELAKGLRKAGELLA